MSASETPEEKIARLMEEQEMLAIKTRKLEIAQEIRGAKKEQQQQQAMEAKKAKEIEEQEEQEVKYLGQGSVKRERETTPPKQQRPEEGSKIKKFEEQEDEEVTFVGHWVTKRGREATLPKQPFMVEHGLPNVAANPAWDTNDKASEAPTPKRARITGSAAKSPATLARNISAEKVAAVPLRQPRRKPNTYDPVSNEAVYWTIIKSDTGDEYVQLACCFCGGNCSQRGPKSKKTPWTFSRGAVGLMCHINQCHESQVAKKMSVEDTASFCVVHTLTPQEKKAVDDKNQYLFSVEPKHAAMADEETKVKAARKRKDKDQNIA